MGLETTTIVGMIYLPNGQRVTGGTVVAALSSSGSANDTVSAATERVGGRCESMIEPTGLYSVSIALVPNDAITPAGTFYRVTFNITSPIRTSWTEGWSVATGLDPIEIGDVTRVTI